MELTEVKQMAADLMAEHNIIGWRFVLDNAYRRAGLCHYGKKQISVSVPFISNNDAAAVKNTILHEIAHVLAGPWAKHGFLWKQKALSIGCTAEVRCHHKPPPFTWQYRCPKCGLTAGRYKKPKRSKFMLYCSKCYRQAWTAEDKAACSLIVEKIS